MCCLKWLPGDLGGPDITVLARAEARCSRDAQTSHHHEPITGSAHAPAQAAEGQGAVTHRYLNCILLARPVRHRRAVRTHMCFPHVYYHTIHTSYYKTSRVAPVLKLADERRRQALSKFQITESSAAAAAAAVSTPWLRRIRCGAMYIARR